MHAALNTLQVPKHEQSQGCKLLAARFCRPFVRDSRLFTAGESLNSPPTSLGAPTSFDDIACAARRLSRSRICGIERQARRLIAMNKAAMFRADSRSVQLGKHLAYESAGGLVLVLLVGAAVSWGLGWRLSKPLTELTERLRGISQRKSQVRLVPSRSPKRFSKRSRAN